jgi:chromosomal replication initiator protein
VPDKHFAMPQIGFEEPTMNIDQAWESVLSQLQSDMPKASFETWLGEARPLTYENGALTIGVPNAYARDWLESRLASTISRLLVGIMSSNVAVNFVVAQAAEFDSPQQESDEGSQRLVSSPRVHHSLNPRYTFDNFVVGSGNRLAHAACQAVADKPAKAYNPLFLYGGVGLGKTHLLHAIGNACFARGLNVLYVSSEEFTNEIINAIRTHTTQAFREKYRNADVLLVDDIQFIAGKESTQEEFFHTFNTLHGQDKQIIVSSDRPPKSLVTLEERMRSRFEWGLAADIQPPDLETRLAILRAKAERTGRRIPDEILESVARRVQSNIRELEGALNRIIAFSDLSGQALTPELVEAALADLLPQRQTILPERIVELVAREWKTTSEALLGRDRSQRVAEPRQVAMYLMRQLTDLSLAEIGRAFGGRDHTTVIHATSKIARLIREDRSVYNLVQELTARIKQAR